MTDNKRSNTARLKDLYEKDIVPALMEKFGYKNRMNVPRLEKIVVNVGMGEMSQQKDLIEPLRDFSEQTPGRFNRLSKKLWKASYVILLVF